MVKLANTFSQFKKTNALVVGDFMLDKYTYGCINRISPEAPVSILKVEKEIMKPGGAGNVVLNLLSLGVNVKALGRIGHDLEGEILSLELKKEKADISHLHFQKEYNTPVKNRLIAGSQQVIRVDFEKIEKVSNEIEEKIIKDLDKILSDIQIVAISDYAKGFLSDNLLKKIIDRSNEKNIPVIVDPKGVDFTKYRGATIIKPNLLEAYLAANVSKNESLDKVSKILLDSTLVKHLIITRSEDGISLFSKNQRDDFPVVSKEVKDVTGAGDTVLATICLALANNLDIKLSCQLANIAASIAIEHVGCVKVTLEDFARRLLENDGDNKIFDVNHLYALKKILYNKDFYLLGIESESGFTTSIFKAIKDLSKKEKNLIIYIMDSNPDQEFIDLLSSLTEVSFIILQAENLKNLCMEIHPKNVFVMKDSKVTQLKHANALIEVGT